MNKFTVTAALASALMVVGSFTAASAESGGSDDSLLWQMMLQSSSSSGYVMFSSEIEGSAFHSASLVDDGSLFGGGSLNGKAAAVPEPVTLGLLGMGLLGIGMTVRRRRHQSGV